MKKTKIFYIFLLLLVHFNLFGLEKTITINQNGGVDMPGFSDLSENDTLIVLYEGKDIENVLVKLNLRILEITSEKKEKTIQLMNLPLKNVESPFILEIKKKDKDKESDFVKITLNINKTFYAREQFGFILNNFSVTDHQSYEWSENPDGTFQIINKKEMISIHPVFLISFIPWGRNFAEEKINLGISLGTNIDKNFFKNFYFGLSIDFSVSFTLNAGIVFGKNTLLSLGYSEGINYTVKKDSFVYQRFGYKGWYIGITTSFEGITKLFSFYDETIKITK